MDHVLHRLQMLKNKGFSPKGILDVGAHQGGWSQLVSRIYDDAKFLMIEANPAHEPYLKYTGIDYSISLVGDQKKSNVNFHSVSGLNTGASIYKENSALYQGEHCLTQSLTMTTLDDLLENHAFKDVNFLKLDVQGAELDVLRGAKKTMESVEFTLLETQVLEYNQQAPMMADVINFMQDINYQVFDIVERHYLPNQLMVQADIIFARKDSNFIPRGTLM